ncbi:MAG TPA: hypothetical protein VF472_21990 [Burkholderiaceae bacterium]
MKNRIAVTFAAVLLAACGDAGTPSNGASQKTQVKTLRPSVKQGASSYDVAVQALCIA